MTIRRIFLFVLLMILIITPAISFTFLDKNSIYANATKNSNALDSIEEPPALSNIMQDVIVYARVPAKTLLHVTYNRHWGTDDARFLIFDPNGNLIFDLSLGIGENNFSVILPLEGTYKILAVDCSISYSIQLDNGQVQDFDWGLVATLRPHMPAFRNNNRENITLKMLVPAGDDFSFHATNLFSNRPAGVQLYDSEGNLVADIYLPEDWKNGFEKVAWISNHREHDEFWTVNLYVPSNSSYNGYRAGFWLENVDYKCNFPILTHNQTFVSSTEDAWFNPFFDSRNATLIVDGSIELWRAVYGAAAPPSVYDPCYPVYDNFSKNMHFGTANLYVSWRWRERDENGNPMNDDNDPNHINWSGFSFNSFDQRYQFFLDHNISPILTLQWSDDAFITTHPANWNLYEMHEFAEFVLATVIHCVAPDIEDPKTSRPPYNITAFQILGEVNLLLEQQLTSDTALEKYIQILKIVGEKIRSYPDDRVSQVRIGGPGIGWYPYNNEEEYTKWITSVLDEADEYIDVLTWDMYEYWSLEETFRYGEDALNFKSLLFNHGDNIADEILAMPEFNLRGGIPTAWEYYDTYYESLYAFGAMANAMRMGVQYMCYFSFKDNIGEPRYKGLFTTNNSDEYSGPYSYAKPLSRKPVSFAAEVIGIITNPDDDQNPATLIYSNITVSQIDHIASYKNNVLTLGISNRFESKTDLKIILANINLTESSAVSIWIVTNQSIRLLEHTSLSGNEIDLTLNASSIYLLKIENISLYGSEEIPYNYTDGSESTSGSGRRWLFPKIWIIIVGSIILIAIVLSLFYIKKKRNKKSIF